MTEPTVYERRADPVRAIQSANEISSDSWSPSAPVKIVNYPPRQKKFRRRNGGRDDEWKMAPQQPAGTRTKNLAAPQPKPHFSWTPWGQGKRRRSCAHSNQGSRIGTARDAQNRSTKGKGQMTPTPSDEFKTPLPPFLSFFPYLFFFSHSSLYSNFGSCRRRFHAFLRKKAL